MAAERAVAAMRTTKRMEFRRGEDVPLGGDASGKGAREKRNTGRRARDKPSAGI